MRMVITGKEALACLTAGLLVSVVACTASQTQKDLASPAGQLFCSIITSSGGSQVVGVVESAGVTAVGASAGPVAAVAATIVIGQTAAWVQAKCNAAAVAVGGVSGIPVVPPVVPVPNVAVPAVVSG